MTRKTAGGDRPSKLYYSIGEVSKLTGVKQHVLRYWETEFPTLRPRKTRSGSRRYRQTDIDEVLAIKRLLYEQGFRIAGARKVLHQAHRQGEEAAQPALAQPQLQIPFAELDASAQLRYVRDELRGVRKMLQDLGGDQGRARRRGAKTTADAAGDDEPGGKPRARAARGG